MRIALIGYEANTKNRVGSNQYAFELIKAIHSLDNKNQYTVFLPTPPLADLPPEKKNWRYQVVGPSKFWNVFGLPWALWRQGPKPEVVFNPGHYSPLFYPGSLVVSIMDLGYLRFPQQFTKPTLFKLKFWTALSIRRASHIFAISETTKNDIIKYYQVESKKVTVTYPGYDRNKFKVQGLKFKTEEVKKKYRIKGDYILFLGTLKPSKNIEGLLEGFKKLKNQKKPKLVIAGRKGWLYGEIFKKVKKLGIEREVIFTGFVEEDDVPFLMAGAKTYVLPSFWEGFGIPVIEAMACGTPVVVAKAGSLPEIVDKAGILVNPREPESIARGIEKVLYHISIYDMYRKRGLEQAKKFSWQDCARKTIKILEKVGGA